MKLSDFLEEIAFGELYDLSFAKNGEIVDERKAMVVIKVNDVLTNLYNKYILDMRPAVIDTSIKQLHYTYDNPNSVQIVYAEPINWDRLDIYKTEGHLTIRGNTLRFNRTPKVDVYNIWYQWSPSRLKTNPAAGGFDNQIVSVPMILLPLVRTLVASAIYINMNNELQKKTGIELANASQYMIADLENMGVLKTSVDYDNIVFMKNGFK